MTDIPDSLRSIILEKTVRARGRSISKRHKKALTHPAAAWTTRARIGGTLGTALSLVLGTQGCSYARGDQGGCTMCSYLLDGTERKPTHDELMSQFKGAMKKLDDQTVPLSVKIYTSGSFLDTEEVSAETRDAILSLLSTDERVAEVVIESRPEYVTSSVMAQVRTILGERHIEIGMGLESSNDTIREICVNKGFTLEDFQKALEIAREYKIGTRAYVLLKPPFLTEKDALTDSINTIKDAIDMGVTTISMNPVTIQKHTLVDSLWNEGLYRSPWLWTVVEVLKETKRQVGSDSFILCDPVAAGKRRGTHNCGKCDKQIVDAIRTFSLNQDPSVFDSLTCECIETWKHTLSHENISLLVHTDRKFWKK